MSRKNSATRNDQNKVSQLTHSKAATAAGASGGDELEQIQNLLFGSRSQEIESNLQELDNRLSARLNELTHSFDQQLQHLHKIIAEQIKRESAERYAENAALSSELNALRLKLSDAVTELREKQENDKKAFNRHVDTTSKNLAAQFEQKNEQVVVQFQQRQQALETDKVSKESLSKLLVELSSAV